MTTDKDKLQDFLEKMIDDLGAASGGALVLIGERLGLYKTIAEAGALSSVELAERTGTAERYVREWLRAQAAAGYLVYDAKDDRYHMTPEQVMVFADPDSPVYMAGAFDVIASMFKDEPRITEAFRSGEGVGWHEHSPCLFNGSAKFFRSSYAAHLVQEWIPSLDGVREKLERGASVADVGCGFGYSTILMAQAFPNSAFVGFDYHRESIERARAEAKDAGADERVSFEVADAKGYPGSGYDLVVCFDCLHDMGDPVGVGQHVLETLEGDGTWMIVEPYANDSVEENLNPVGRVYYSASTMICTPASLSQEVGLALGAQAGEAQLREVVTAAGFTRFRRAAETPFNIVLEART